MIKIAIVIAFRDFRDEEYFIPRSIFLQNGFKVKTVSTYKGLAIGENGGEAGIDILLSDLKLDNYDCLMFIDGPGTYRFIEDEMIHEVVRSYKGLLAAIGIAPAILAKAGVLERKKATVWSSSLEKETINILKDHNAKYVDKKVVIDDNIITANDLDAVEEFALAIVNKLI
jgi:protease I